MRLRVAGKVPGPIEGGGRASGYFTGATGITIYRGDAWPVDGQGLAIVGDACTNLVHRKRLEPNGLELIARRIDAISEFVASRDIWFRPVQFANAPDGALYIADMYREVIEHPLSLPPVIKRHLDLMSGRDRGRIYRVVPEGFTQRAMPRLGQATGEELVATLAHKNGWHRETAARLLYQRRDKNAVAALTKLAATSDLPEGRMHALYALAGQDALTSDVVLAALADSDPRVRVHAVRLAEAVARGTDNDVVPMREKLLQLARDEKDPQVAYQLLFSLGELVPDAARDKALAALARRDPADRWMRLALVSSLGSGVAGVFGDLVDDMDFRRSEAGQMLLATLAGQAGSAGRKEDVAAVLTAVESLPDADLALTAQLVRGLMEGAARQGASLEQIVAGSSGGRTGEVLAKLVAEAQATVRDNDRAPAARVPAIQMLALVRAGRGAADLDGAGR